MACLNRAAEALAASFPSVTIVERHHEGKRDAPSGSARDTAARLERLRGGASVPILSVRAPGLYAHQEVLFGGPGETLVLRHDMLGPEAFGPGLLAALRYAARAQGVAFGLEAALASEG
jgi:4-hydroxy-tetrahydrodipicolinate reductase